MSEWTWALLFKPIAAILVIAVVFGVPILLTNLLRPLFPEGRLKNWLFRKRGSDSASSSANAPERILDKPAVTRREIGEDRTGL